MHLTASKLPVLKGICQILSTRFALFRGSLLIVLVFAGQSCGFMVTVFGFGLPSGGFKFGFTTQFSNGQTSAKNLDSFEPPEKQLGF